MAKKYGRNTFILRGHVEFESEKPVGVDKVLLAKGYMNIPGRDDKVMRVPIEAWRDAGQLIKDHNGEWVEVEGRLEGREYEGKTYPSNKVFEIKLLPMHKEEDQPSDGQSTGEPPPEPPAEDDEGVPF